VRGARPRPNPGVRGTEGSSVVQNTAYRFSRRLGSIRRHGSVEGKRGNQTRMVVAGPRTRLFYGLARKKRGGRA